jgi:DNA-binding NtrC family response regulator
MDPSDRAPANTVNKTGAFTTGVPSLRLVVQEGPDAGAIFPLSGARGGRLLLGTSPSCDFRLTDPHVSRRHLSFDFHRGRPRVFDLDSTNGSTLDGTLITGAFLDEGQLLRVGSTALRVSSDDAPEQPVVAEDARFGRYLGVSVAMRRLYPKAKRIAASDIPVIIEGETGTGKEVFAEAIHETSARASGPYVVFDCTTVAPTLLESELFGHEKGAFTGAAATRKGVFEEAHGGTLLLDEIGDLPAPMQPKLLRAIERSEIRRVGGNEVIRVNVRLIAATRRDLDKEVEAGRFRDDLFHRLAVARIELPPLRERRGDITLLARHFWASIQGDPRGPSADVLERWERAAWPGNVRELRNAVIRECALGSEGLEEGAAHGPPSIRGAPVEAAVRAAAVAALGRGEAFPLAKRAIADEFERAYLDALLAKHHGDTAKAAADAGVARRYLQLLLARQK